MHDAMVGKVTISVSLKKIHFQKISEQAPLIKNNINKKITENRDTMH